MRQVFAVTGALFLLAACGSDLKPLNDTQKGILRDTSISTARVAFAAKDLSASPKNKAASPLNQDAAATTVNQGQDAIEKEMFQSLSTEQCQVTDLSGLVQRLSGPIDLKFGMNGPSCPALINAEAKIDGGLASGINADYSLSYQVQSGAKYYLNFNDVSAVQLAGNVAVNLGIEGDGGYLDIHTNTQGAVTSQKRGQIRTWIEGGIKISADSQGNTKPSGKIIADFWYPSFRAELVADFDKLNGQGQPSLTLNGEPMTPDELTSYIGFDPSTLGFDESQHGLNLAPASFQDEMRARIQNFVHGS